MNNYKDSLKDVPGDLVKKCQALELIDSEAQAAEASEACAPLADAEAVATSEDAADKAKGNVANDDDVADEPASKRRKVESPVKSKASPAKPSKTITTMVSKKGRGGGGGGGRGRVGRIGKLCGRGRGKIA